MMKMADFQPPLEGLAWLGISMSLLLVEGLTMAAACELIMGSKRLETKRKKIR